MRSAARLLLPACMLVASPAHAQVRPAPGLGDQRIQSVQYQPDQVVLIEALPGYLVTVELAPDEAIESAAVGDSGAWQVSANKAGNRLFVKPLTSGNSTNLAVVTTVRSYSFDLVSGGGSGAPYTVRFTYSTLTDQPPSTVPAAEQRQYRIKGSKELQPLAMSDDGTHTFIEWAADAALPATYTIDRNGHEALANGSMRGGVYVLDDVAERVVFRIDRRVAYATREKPTQAR